MSVPSSELSPDFLDKLYAQERSSLLKTALLLTGDRGQAEDLVHDAFLALHQRPDALDDPARAAGYLRVSVINGARSVHRRRGVTRRHLRSAESATGPAADVAVLLAEEHRELVAAVRRLPRRQQEVVILRYWADMSERDIAEALGVAAGTVKTCAARGLARIEKELRISS